MNSRKAIIVFTTGLALASIGGALWVYRVDMAKSSVPLLRTVSAYTHKAAGAAGLIEDGSNPATGDAPDRLRKCVQGERVVYANAACPAGFKERTVEAPPVSVVVPPSEVREGGSGSNPIVNIQKVLGTQDGGSLRDKRSDRVIEGR